MHWMSMSNLHLGNIIQYLTKRRKMGGSSFEDDVGEVEVTRNGKDWGRKWDIRGIEGFM